MPDDLRGKAVTDLRKSWPQRSAHRSVPALAQGIRDWVETLERQPRPFTWRKSAEGTIDRLAGYCRSLNK